jgi:hypothetical protein
MEGGSPPVYKQDRRRNDMPPLVMMNQRESRYSRGPEALDALEILLKE